VKVRTDKRIRVIFLRRVSSADGTTLPLKWDFGRARWAALE